MNRRAYLAAVVCLLPIHAFADDLPDNTLTPGAVLTTDLSTICQSGYTQTVRNVSAKEKTAVYREYNIATHAPHEYEVDHLISLELGGSNDIKNLWPQSYETCPWNAHVKDTLENVMHQKVCSGELLLPFVQVAIAQDWIALYHQYIGDPPPCKQTKQAKR